ncbi:Uncharacterised protein [Raoultella ornithinolytica]|nr:Uncharacterised protein [Raoultella ornithinolytica]
MDAYHRHQMGMSRLVVVLEERTVLIVVGVEVFLRQLLVGLNKVVKDFDFQINALFGQLRLYKLKDFRVRYRRGADGQRLVGGDRGGEEGQQPGSDKGFFHDFVHGFFLEK